MANKYEVQRDSKILGSFTSAELREMAAKGTLSGDDLIRNAGSDGGWSMAGNVKSLNFQTEQANPIDVTSTISDELHVNVDDPAVEGGAHWNEPKESSTTQPRNHHLQGDVLPEKIRSFIHDNEDVLYASRPSKNALVISIVVCILVYALPAILFALFMMQFASWLGIPRFPIALVALIIGFGIPIYVTYLSWKNTYYVITSGRTIVMKGIFNIATKIILNDNIQLISINTGIIDRWLDLNTIELSTAAQGGGMSGIFSFFPGMSKGCVTLNQVVVEDVIKHYAQL
jgi:membrane protein YdbS with pleckstrin-like domain